MDVEETVSTENPSPAVTTAPSRSRQRRGLLSSFYYILATLAFMFVMFDFTHRMWSALVHPRYPFFEATHLTFNDWFESNVGWLVGGLSIVTIGRVIQLLQQIRDK
jgi:hypothetical protein